MSAVLYKKHSRTRQDKPLISKLIFHSGPTTYHYGCACWHTGDDSHPFGLYKDQPMSEDDRTWPSVSMAHWSYWGPVWSVLVSQSDIPSSSFHCWGRYPLLLFIQLYWCLKKSCASWFMHVLKGLIKYKFINDAMGRFNLPLTGLQKFQQDVKYTWFKSGKQNIFNYIFWCTYVNFFLFISPKWYTSRFKNLTLSSLPLFYKWLYLITDSLGRTF